MKNQYNPKVCGNLNFLDKQTDLREIRLVAGVVLGLRANLDVGGLVDDLLHSVLNELVEGVELLADQALLFEVGGDDGPGVFLSDFLVVVVVVIVLLIIFMVVLHICRKANSETLGPAKASEKGSVGDRRRNPSRGFFLLSFSWGESAECGRFKCRINDA